MLQRRHFLTLAIILGIGCWIAVGIVLAVVASKQYKHRNSFGVFITSSNFGLIQPDGSIHSTLQIPHKSGTRFGWSLNITPSGGMTRIREVFVLPEGGTFGPKPESNPQELNVVEYTISADGREQTEVFEIQTHRSFTVIDQYPVDEDEPPGHGHVILHVNEIEVARFDFEVR
jgi:hypothetical protein